MKIERLKPAEIDMSSMRKLVFNDFDNYRGDIDSMADFVVGIVARGSGHNYGEDYRFVRLLRMQQGGCLTDGRKQAILKFSKVSNLKIIMS